jgi:hypothetical protein
VSGLYSIHGVVTLGQGQLDRALSVVRWGTVSEHLVYRFLAQV